jgi:hypothetical protein
MRQGILLLIVLIFSGCKSVDTTTAMAHVEAAREIRDPRVSLFSSDADVLSDEDIARILKTKIDIPDSIRIGLIYLEHREPTEELRIAAVPVNMLLEQDRIYDVSYLPTFLIPDNLTVGVIREAGARYQADWILLFRTETKKYSKNNIWGADPSKSYCIAECAVLDVRTGIIPFTSTAEAVVTAEKTKEDYSEAEAFRRGEIESIEKAMTENVENLIRYLKGDTE